MNAQRQGNKQNTVGRSCEAQLQSYENLITPHKQTSMSLCG